MSHADRCENPSGALASRGGFDSVDANEKPLDDPSLNDASRLQSDIAQTIGLGEQFIGVIGGIFDLARTEALLAIRTLPKLIMLWLLMMPIILLTWCAFSALVAWTVVASSNQIGFGLFTFFLLQVLLLSGCRWLFVKYRERMAFPYTREQINDFVRSVHHEFNRRDKTKE
ncbi:hypothetical protein [Cellvibrio sp. pealriver]|uniref:hypothetical protein n=1 Tax=Cellvibrio sp. pealriver TaxID=1622269 RepID=UPI00066FF927|nr:hypothetical protein [Cellvibrio sp. pealriver]